MVRGRYSQGKTVIGSMSIVSLDGEEDEFVDQKEPNSDVTPSSGFAVEIDYAVDEDGRVDTPKRGWKETPEKEKIGKCPLLMRDCGTIIKSMFNNLDCLLYVYQGWPWGREGIMGFRQPPPTRKIE